MPAPQVFTQGNNVYIAIATGGTLASPTGIFNLTPYANATGWSPSVTKNDTSVYGNSSKQIGRASCRERVYVLV